MSYPPRHNHAITALPLARPFKSLGAALILGSILIILSFLSLPHQHIARAAPSTESIKMGNFSTPVNIPFTQPLQEDTISVTHTGSLTHEMSVFGNGRITNQFFADSQVKIDQIGNNISATTIAVLFDQLSNQVDIASHNDFTIIAPITHTSHSTIPGFDEDTYANYASQALSYQIEQRTFATIANNCVVMEFIIENTGLALLTGGKLMYMIDINAGQVADQDIGHYAAQQRLLYLTDYNEIDQLGYAVGIALLRGNLTGYGVEGNLAADFTSDSSFISKMTASTGHIANGPNNITWLVVDIPTLPPGAQTPTAFSLCANTAFNSDEAQAQEEAEENLFHSLEQLLNFSASKTASPPAGSSITGGEPVTYTITITNNGHYYLDNIVVTDLLPAFTELIAYDISQGSISANSGGITAETGRLYAAAEPVTITLGIVPSTAIADQTSINNQALIEIGSMITTTNIVSHQVINHIIAHTIIAAIDSITESNTDTKVTFTITRTGALNIGSSVAVSISDTVSTGLDYHNVTVNGPNIIWSNGVIFFGPGAFSATLSLNIINDQVDEADEMIRVTLSNPQTTSGSGYTATVSGPGSAVTTIIDDDVAGVTITQTNSSTLVIEGGVTDTYQVVLNSQPTGPVTITALPGNSQINLGNGPGVADILTFNPTNWHTSQPVTIAAVNDTVAEGDHITAISHTAAGGGYDTISINPVNVTIVDNDIGHTLVTQVNNRVEGHHGLSQINLTIARLGAIDASSSVDFSLGGDALYKSDYDNIAVHGGNIIWNDDNTIFFNAWAVSATLSLDLIGDQVDETDETIQVVISNTKATFGSVYSAVLVLPTSAAITIMDDDTAGATITRTNGSAPISEAGGFDSYQMALNSQPTGDVTITATPNNTEVNLGSGPGHSASLTFSPINWHIPQSVTIMPIDDLTVEDDQIVSISHSAAGGGYDTVAIDPVDITIIDDDKVYRTYLPVMQQNFIHAPDLVVEDLIAASDTITVVVKNKGNTAVVSPFWVDVYINLAIAPVVEQIWSDFEPDIAGGLAWRVSKTILPGETLTLMSGGLYYQPDFSYFPKPLPGGIPIFAQVDSSSLDDNPNTGYGAIQESHEIIGAPYNNTQGPVLSLGAIYPKPDLPAMPEALPANDTSKSVQRP